MARGTLYVGTSGFAYKQWKPDFYPAELRAADMLGFYARTLTSVEINNTFYRLPSTKVLDGWKSQTPEQFVFTLKASRRITHMKRLRDVEEPLGYFLESAGTLGDRLGCLTLPVSSEYGPEGRPSRGLSRGPTAQGVPLRTRISEPELDGTGGGRPPRGQPCSRMCRRGRRTYPDRAGTRARALSTSASVAWNTESPLSAPGRTGSRWFSTPALTPTSTSSTKMTLRGFGTVSGS